MNRYFTSFITTALVYTFAGYVFFLYISSSSFIIKKEEKPKIISLRHIQLIEEPKKIVKVIPPVQREVVKKPLLKPIVKKPIKRRIVKKKLLVKKPIKKRIIKIKQKAKPVQKIVKKQTIQKVVSTKAIVKQVKAKSIKKAVKQDIKKVYLAKNLFLIRKQIQKYIKYPRRAKKFGIQDIVRVRFKLLSNGKIVDIVLLKGHKLFNKATIKAIQKASFKFPKVQKAITIELPIEYKLI